MIKWPLRRRMVAEWGLDIDGTFVPWSLLEDLSKQSKSETPYDFGKVITINPEIAPILEHYRLAEKYPGTNTYRAGPELQELIESYEGEDWNLPEDSLLEKLANLHLNAGAPSSRMIAAGVGGISHTTANNALRGHKFPSWKVMSEIIVFLGGNPDEFLPIWRQARGERKNA